MTALVRAISHAGIQINVEPLKTIAVFCGVGLFVSLLFVSYGIDLSPGFFFRRSVAGALSRCRRRRYCCTDTASRR